MKRLFTILFILLLLQGTAYSTTYYVSNDGNDIANGTSPATSWRTLTKISLILSALKPGDKVLFKRGDIFNSVSNSYNEILDIKSSGRLGNYIKIGAYGSGANPIINGQSPVVNWNIAINWTNTSGNIWKTSWSENSSHRLWVDDVEYARCANNTTPTSSEPFSTDGTHLYVYSPKGNPATIFSKMESTLGLPGIQINNQSYLMIEDLDIRGYSGGIQLFGCSDIILQRDSIGYNCQGTGVLIRRENSGSYNFLVTNCTFNTNDHIFHSFEEKSTEDGIHVSDDSHNIEVSHCSFINWGHAAAYMLNYYHVKGYSITNVKFKTSYYTSPDINYGYGPCADIFDFNSTGNEIDSNIIYKTGLALQIQCPYIKVYDNIINGTYGHTFGSNPESSGITLSGYYAYPQYMQIYNNTIVNCSGYGIAFHNSRRYKTIQNNLIANNILFNNKGEGPGNRGNYSYVQLSCEDDSTILNNTFKNNLLYATGVTNVISYGHAPNQNFLISVSQFNLYNGNAEDVIIGNIGGDPLFLSATDFHLQLMSPAINAGTQVGLPYNGSAPDIGAHETATSSSPGYH